MTTINIDTLEITGEGDDYQACKGYAETQVLKGIGVMSGNDCMLRKLHVAILYYMQPSGKLTAEMKRILMVCQVLKDEGGPSNIDIAYSRDFTKGSYSNFHHYGITFKILLGVKHNYISVKTTTIDHEISVGYDGVLDHVENLVKHTKDIKNRIDAANEAFGKSMLFMTKNYKPTT